MRSTTSAPPAAGAAQRLADQRGFAVAARRDQEDLLSGRRSRGQPVELDLPVDEGCLRNDLAVNERMTCGLITAMAVTTTEFSVMAGPGQCPGPTPPARSTRPTRTTPSAPAAASPAAPASRCRPAGDSTGWRCVRFAAAPRRSARGSCGLPGNPFRRQRRRRSRSSGSATGPRQARSHRAETPAGRTIAAVSPGSRGTIESRTCSPPASGSTSKPPTLAGAGPSGGADVGTRTGAPAGPTARRWRCSSGGRPPPRPGDEIQAGLDPSDLRDGGRGIAVLQRAHDLRRSGCRREAAPRRPPRRLRPSPAGGTR